MKGARSKSTALLGLKKRKGGGGRGTAGNLNEQNRWLHELHGHYGIEIAEQQSLKDIDFQRLKPTATGRSGT